MNIITKTLRSFDRSLTKTEKELYEKEIKKLKTRCGDMEIKLKHAEKYRNEYKELCADLKEKKKKYEKLIDAQEKLFNEYNVFLDRIWLENSINNK